MPDENGRRTIVAVTGDDPRHEPVRRHAAERARDGNATVILYDLDAAGVLSAPVPTQWSSEGEQDFVGDRLPPEELEANGRAGFAAQVRALREEGVDAWGWLPTSPDTRDLVAYAERQRAEVILVPEALERPGLVDRLTGRDAETARDASSIPIVTVGGDGRPMQG